MSNNMNPYKTKNDINTEILSTPFERKDPYNALSFPIYNCAAYEFASAEDMEKAFCGKSHEHTYSRISNPTVQNFEQRIKAFTKAHSVTALSSGMAAISNTILNIGASGKNIITSSHLFGNTYSVFASTFKNLGIEARFCDLCNISEIEKNIDTNTVAIFLEVITNPQLEIADLMEISDLAHKNNIPVIADTTVVPFHIFDPAKYGIDISIVSSTKYISGGATSLGGLIIDYGNFDWSHNTVLRNINGNPELRFTTRLRKEIHRNLGSYMSPQTAYIQNLGLETLTVRFERQASTTMAIAGELADIPGICSVNYPGLKNNKFNEISTKQFGKYPGALLTFELSGKESCFKFMNKLKLIRRATNLFDSKTLAIHPASTIFGSFSAEERRRMDVFDTTIRLSTGLESPGDILADIKQALI